MSEEESIEVYISSPDNNVQPFIVIPPTHGACLQLPTPDGWTKDDSLCEVLEDWTLYVRFLPSMICREMPLIYLDGETIKYDVLVREDHRIETTAKYANN
jgi:hypothetical protein